MKDYNKIDPKIFEKKCLESPREIYILKHWVPSLEEAVEKYCINKSVLELGCGYGRHTEILRKYTQNLIGLDISKKWLDYAKKKYPDVKFILADVHKIPFKENFFDVVFNAGLFEYVNRKIVMEEIRRVLKKQGIGIILASNKYSMARMPIKLIYKILRKEYYCDEPSRKEMLQLFKDNNFELIEEKMDDGLIWLPDFLDKIFGNKTYFLIERLFSIFEKNPFSNGMFFIIRKNT